MGNLCSTTADRRSDPFSQPGRPLGTTPPARTSASVPASAGKTPRRVGGPPRTLGGGGGGGDSGPSTPAGQGQGGAGGGDAAAEARRRAGEAAAARLENTKTRTNTGGKLASQLAQQRAMTDADVLREASDAERRRRDLDASTAALNHS